VSWDSKYENVSVIRAQKLERISISILAICNCFYFFADFQIFKIYQHAEFMETDEVRRDHLLRIYNHEFRNTFRFNHNGSNRSLSLELAHLYWADSDHYNSEKYFFAALSEMPNSVEVKLSFAKYLLQNSSCLFLASRLLEEILLVYPLHGEANLLLSNVFLLENNYKRALECMNQEYVDRKIPYMYIVEFMLYNSQYFKKTYGSDIKPQIVALDSILTTIDFVALKNELLNNELSSERRRRITGILRKTMKYFERELYLNLEAEEFQLFLENTSKYSYGRKLRVLDLLIEPTNEQGRKVKRLLFESFNKQRFCRISGQIKDINAISCSTRDYSEELLREFSLIFSEQQLDRLNRYVSKVPWFLKSVY